MSDKRGARGRAAVIPLVATAWLAWTTSALAEPRPVRIVNDTRHAIVRFHASVVTAGSWEDDLLGTHRLSPGQSVTIDLDDGSGECLYDFKAVFDDGDEVVKTRIDVCTIESYRYTE